MTLQKWSNLWACATLIPESSLDETEQWPSKYVLRGQVHYKWSSQSMSLTIMVKLVMACKGLVPI